MVDSKGAKRGHAQGALLQEATRPYLRKAVQAALAPTVATMTTTTGSPDEWEFICGSAIAR